MTTPNILLVTKGHPFERDAFFGMFDDMDMNWTRHPIRRKRSCHGNTK